MDGELGDLDEEGDRRERFNEFSLGNLGRNSISIFLYLYLREHGMWVSLFGTI